MTNAVFTNMFDNSFSVVDKSEANPLLISEVHHAEYVISYNVITTFIMSTVFEGRIRRLGNSLAVIIPKEILDETGAREGDTLKLSLLVPSEKRKEAFRKMAGIDEGASRFERDKRDRI